MNCLPYRLKNELWASVWSNEYSLLVVLLQKIDIELKVIQTGAAFIIHSRTFSAMLVTSIIVPYSTCGTRVYYILHPEDLEDSESFWKKKSVYLCEFRWNLVHQYASAQGRMLLKASHITTYFEMSFFYVWLTAVRGTIQSFRLFFKRKIGITSIAT